MRSHLKSRHEITIEPTRSAIQEEVNKQLEQLYLQAETSNQTEEVDTRVLRKVLDSDRIHEAFVSLLVTANLPFRLVELPQFHAYNQCLNPEAAGFVTTSHSHVATKDYGIVRNIGAIVADNATTNDTLCRAISKYLREEEQVDWDPVFQRVRCIGHIINLAVQDFLFQDIINMQQLAAYDEEDERGNVEDEAGRRSTVRGIGSLGKLHNIVTFIRGSPGRTKRFKKVAGRMIPLDNRTRWNSWYTMVQVALDHE
ncbi:hypothetical protein Egran_06618, partial [Elaphomyces granulatus]